jgi:hypothetical protein
MRLVSKWQEFVRIEDILVQLQSRAIARMPLVLAVGAVRSLHVLVKQCERSFRQMGVQDQLVSARRQIKCVFACVPASLAFLFCFAACINTLCVRECVAACVIVHVWPCAGGWPTR